MLKRTLTIWDAVALTIGSVLGSGLLLLPGLTYHDVGSGGALLAWLFMGMMAIPFILIFSNLTQRHPDASGIAGYIAQAFGSRWSKGATYVLAGTFPVGIPALSLIGANYVAYALGLNSWQTMAVGYGVVLLAVGTNWMGVKAGTRLQNITVALLSALLTVTVFLVLPHSRLARISWHLAWHPLWQAMALVFWAYLGWENMSFTAEEFRNPQRDFRFSLFIGFAVILLLYLGITFSVVTILPQTAAVTTKAPIAGMFHQILGGIGGDLVALLAFLITVINANAWVWGGSRLYYSGGRDQVLPPFLGRIDNASGAPRHALATLWILYTLNYVGMALWHYSITTLILNFSQNFLVLYLLSIFAYFKLNRSWRSRLLAVMTLIVTGIFMAVFTWMLLYPVLLFAIAWLLPLRQHQHAAESVP
ncbi:amino acid/polyamine/organocation transporter, APC superfamily [Sulfobacillus thermosulfidooxidans DSM 9293]|uniref:Amino acid/polyamine/organocation transporter, APC superfamily n=1 Tax=Sulfobacillus thermosulfidooxidans (strain DSM 9293 / VKM B-1269 / AT-1) TaxID=929705 RepID=A0A1W1WHW4_SULTA|nr:amino acid permease [Sulfobacillus thermosulfidooxidans]SMC05901.1 amino acid/polyamine/organocation transporter, APC superfamily [Sulfobacillus thermosulfidooxidans DSM 9293]